MVILKDCKGIGNPTRYPHSWVYYGGCRDMLPIHVWFGQDQVLTNCDYVSSHSWQYIHIEPRYVWHYLMVRDKAQFFEIEDVCHGLARIMVCKYTWLNIQGMNVDNKWKILILKYDQ